MPGSNCTPFSAGTVVSASVWNRKVGGVCAVTWVSIRQILDQRRIGIGTEERGHGALMRERRLHGDDGVTEDEEIGAAVGAVYGVGGVGLARVEVSARGGGEVAAGGEAHDADAVGTNAEFGGAGANGAESALGVAQFDGVMILGAQAVLENESSHAHGVEPFGNVAALFVHREVDIAAAGADDDGGSGSALAFDDVGSNGGLIDIFRALRAGSAVGPEKLGLGRTGLGH